MSCCEHVAGSAADVAAAVANVLRGLDYNDPGLEVAHRCYRVALDAAGLAPGHPDDELTESELQNLADHYATLAYRKSAERRSQQ